MPDGYLPRARRHRDGDHRARQTFLDHDRRRVRRHVGLARLHQRQARRGGRVGHRREPPHLRASRAAEDMLEPVRRRGAGLPKPMPADDRSHAARSAARSRGTGLEPASVTATTMEALPIPLGVSGTGASSLAEIAEYRFAEHGRTPSRLPGRLRARAEPTARVTPTPFAPGERLRRRASPTGTSPTTRPGRPPPSAATTPSAFGHPFFDDAPATCRSACRASKVIAIDKGRVLGHEFGSLTEAHGTMTEDRFAGIAGIVRRPAAPRSRSRATSRTSTTGPRRIGHDRASPGPGAGGSPRPCGRTLSANFAAVFRH